MKLNIKCTAPNNTSRTNHVAALNWFSGKTTGNRPVLAICYVNGKAQLMIDENDDSEFKNRLILY